jgi:hypothetical protein
MTKNQARWVDAFQKLEKETNESKCSKYKHKLFYLFAAIVCTLNLVNYFDLNYF